MTGFREEWYMIWKIILQNCEGWTGEERTQMRV